MKLVLFDIDGTLLLTDGAGRRAIHTALIDVFGSTGPRDYWFDGKTDRQIVRDLMRIEGFIDDEINARMDALFARYLECLTVELVECADRARALPGTSELLAALVPRSDIVVGLLTGNLEGGAMAKLRAVGLDPGQFAVGAFGSDEEHRDRLPAVAQRRARERLGIHVSGAEMVIIGDTPSDIHCGRPLGARAIAVATGRFGMEELAQHGAVAVLPDLSRTDAVLQAILDA